MLGSSHVPKAGRVVEKARAYWSVREAARFVACRCRGARRALVAETPPRRKPWKALMTAAVPLAFMIAICRWESELSRSSVVASDGPPKIDVSTLEQKGTSVK